MNKQMRDLATWSIKTAKSAGADDCRVSINNERFVEIRYRKRKPENIKEAASKGLFIEIYVKSYRRCSVTILPGVWVNLKC